ncbi:hypothetical protein AVEN_246250-1 [Araneus ventricosus]|uniref:Uncharacterized protein n=1 Tax=Araneus ventricosus TaxID=182803 RepID=A0A4Y2LAM0_ARAVE|nr:hypothetical protein AVEN_246250-1 [Araneus ventricosus]
MTTYRNCNVQAEFQENPFAVAIVTPIMKRSHCLPTSKEIIFVDSTSSCDAESHSVAFMLTPCAAGWLVVLGFLAQEPPSAAGAVPVGIFITKGQTESSYKQGFRLILNILKESAFCNKGGPATFITDDSDAEISALKKTWPQSQHFLCIFHVGQAVWRWLWDSKNGIPNNYRKQLMSHFQQIMYAETPACAEEAYLNAVGPPHGIISTNELNRIFNSNNKCIAVDGFNAKHSGWSLGRLNQNGNIINDYICNNNFIFIPPESKHFPHNRNNPSMLDFGVLKNFSSGDATYLNELCSDHNQVSFEIDIIANIPAITKTFKTTNWMKFYNIVKEAIPSNPNINSTKHIDEVINKITAVILTAINKPSKAKLINGPHRKLLLRISNKITLRNQIKNRWQITYDSKLQNNPFSSFMRLVVVTQPQGSMESENYKQCNCSTSVNTCKISLRSLITLNQLTLRLEEQVGWLVGCLGFNGARAIFG